jgi:hypothetical protein
MGGQVYLEQLPIISLSDIPIKRTDVPVRCVSSPLNSHRKGYKDPGYSIPDGYQGLINEARCEIKISLRYFFQARVCMLQWRTMVRSIS